jgi:glutamine amidotransferase
MQLLFEKSEEFGEHEGLSILKGKVVKFDEKKVPLIPHIGWNNIEIKKSIENGETGGDFKPSVPEFRNIKNGTFFYFLHSYYCVPEEDIVAATCFYYEEFTACVKKDNIFACQFHPEKSHNGGLELLKNFVSQ